MTCEIFELLFGRVDLRVQFIEVLGVELSRDGFVDVLDHRIIPEPYIFICGIETSNLSRASDKTGLVSPIETTRSTYNVCPTPRGSQETKS